MVSRDVSLIIRAKDDATKAFDAAAASLEALLGVNEKVGSSATQTGSRLEQLAAAATTLDKAYSKINSAADAADAVLRRQQATLAESRAQLLSLAGQADGAAAAINKLRGDDAIASAGKNQTARIQQIQFLLDQLDRLDLEQQKVTASIKAQETTIQDQQGNLQRLGSTAIAAADAQAKLTAETVLETEAVERAAAASLQLTEIQQRINATVGVGSAAKFDGVAAGAAASVLAEVAAHDQLIQRLKAEQAVATELAASKEAQARAATLLPGNGIGSAQFGKAGSAQVSASVFTAADQQAAAAFETQIKDNAAAAKELESAAARLRAQIDPLAVIQDKLNTEIAEATSLYRANRLSAAELEKVLALLNSNATRAKNALGAGAGKPSMFGLKPFELQNLSFQINDIFTQLASGTSLTQTLAQQGGQIFQIFPRAGAAIIAAFASPPVLAFAAAVGSVIVGLVEINKQAELLRTFQGVLAGTADASEGQAKALALAAEQLDHFGLSAKDAVAIVRVFNNEGVNPVRVLAFGEAAKNMADRLGIDVKDAAKQVAEAFTGTYTSVKKLDDALNFLTIAQRDHIRTLFDEGRAQDALTESFAIFARKQDEGAEKARGPWSEAVRSLTTAWHTFVDVLAGSPILLNTAKGLDNLALSVTALLNRLAGVRTVSAISTEIQVLNNQVKELEAQKGLAGGVFDPKLQKQIEGLTAQVQALKGEQKKVLEQNGKLDGTSTTGGSDARRLKATEDLVAETDKLVQKNKQVSDEERLAAAERAARLEADTELQKDNLRFANDAAKVAFTQQKIEIARQEVLKQITAEKEKQARQDEAAIKAFSQKAPALESSNDPNAKNPKSTATGLGQFTADTWLDLFRRNFPTQAAQMGEQAILELRKDSETTKKLIEVYARENADVLKKAGDSVTEANLFLAHFLGATGAQKIINAANNTPVSDLLSPKAIKANPTILQGKTAGDVRDFAANQVADSSAAEGAAAARLKAIRDQQQEAQTRFNESVKDENDKRKLAIASLTVQNTLQNSALIAKEREEAIAAQILLKQQQIDKINADRRIGGLPEIQFTEAERKEVERLSGAYFDLANAKRLAQAHAKEVDQPVQDLTARREALQAQIDALQVRGGDTTGLQQSLVDLNGQLDSAIQKLADFWRGVLAGAEGGPAAFNLTADAIRNMITSLETAKTVGNGLGHQFLATGRQINESIAQGAASAFDRFAQSVADGKDVVSSLGDAFLQFAADFLREIAQMIIKQAIFNAIGGAAGGGGGGAGGAIASVIGSLFHQGGVVGSGVQGRLVDSSMYANAIRYHSGGIAGLQPGEVPAILKRNEEVLTENDPRNVLNGGRSQAAAPNVKVVNVFDPADVINKGLGSKVGEQAFLNFVQQNAGAVKAALGGV